MGVGRCPGLAGGKLYQGDTVRMTAELGTAVVSAFLRLVLHSVLIHSTLSEVLFWRAGLSLQICCPWDVSIHVAITRAAIQPRLESSGNSSLNAATASSRLIPEHYCLNQPLPALGQTEKQPLMDWFLPPLAWLATYTILCQT